MTYWVNVDFEVRTARIHTSECPHVDEYGKSRGTVFWRKFRTLALAHEAVSAVIGNGDIQICDVCHPGPA